MAAQENKDESNDPSDLDIDPTAFDSDNNPEKNVDEISIDIASSDTMEEEPKSIFSSPDFLKQFALVLVLFFSLIIGVLILNWANQPDMRPFLKLEAEEMIPVLDLLEKHKYIYDLDQDVLSVDQDKLQEIKLLLVREGVDTSGSRRISFLNQDSGFGVSQQLESARLKYEQEQNLASTIEELKNVKRAKVILALPNENVFARDKDKTTATVVITLKNTQTIPQEEVDAIVDLVASAVQGLATTSVTVTDQNGRLLNSGSQDLAAARAKREFELVKQKESEYMDKIDSILIPIIGRTDFIAQVDVIMDFTSIEQTSKRYNPDTPSVRSEMIVENQNKGSVVAGIPGALTNQPPMESEIPQQAQGANNSKEPPSSSHSEATRNYELDTTINHMRQQVGVVRRVSVSVAVNHKEIAETIEFEENSIEEPLVDEAPNPDEDQDQAQEQENDTELAEQDTSLDVLGLTNKSKTIYKRVPRTTIELLNIRRLLEGAIGFSESRGDVIEVVNVKFIEIHEEELPETPFWKTEEFLQSLQIAAALVVAIILIFAVIRPLIVRLMGVDETEPSIADMEDQFADESLGPLDDSGLSNYSYSEDGALQLPEMSKDDEVLQMVRTLVENEPELAVQVVKIWLKEDGLK
jgi:flagellar M-ring protein FliF